MAKNPENLPSTQTSSTSSNNSDFNPNASIQITTVRLNGSNFLEWAQSVKLAIDGRGKLGFLTGEEIKPRESDPSFRKWRSENSLITTWLLNSMEESIRKPYLFMSAQEVWEAVRETYSNLENFSQAFELKTRLWNSKQGEADITTYYNRMLALWQELDLCYNDEWENPKDLARFKKREEVDRVFMFLAGVNAGFDDVKGRVLGRRPLPTIREVFSELRQEEGRKRAMTGSVLSPAETEGSALAVRGNEGDSDKKKKPWCDHCKRHWHTKDTCWKLHGKPPNWQPNWKKKQEGGKALNTVTETTAEPSSTSVQPPFTKEQIEHLLKLFKSSQTSNSNSASASYAHQGNQAPSALTSSNISGPWIIDSGATDHMTSCSHLFSTYSPCAGNKKIKVADGSFSAIAGTGSIKISSLLTLKDVLHVPKLSCNLLSVSKLTLDQNCHANFFPSYCEFQDMASGKMIGNAKISGGLYYFDDGSLLKDYVSNTCFGVISGSSKNDIMLWHFRLGHPSFHYLKRLFPSLFSNKDPSFFQCEICALAKMHRSPYISRPYVPSKPFSLIHSDIWGPSRISTPLGKRWFVTFIDDHTRMTWVYLMTQKSEVEHIFKTFYNMIYTQFETKIKVLRSDNGREYFTKHLSVFFSQNGIFQQSSCVDTPQQNGIAERKNRHLLEVARALLFTHKVPKIFWGDAVLTAIFLINRMPSKVLNFATPISEFSKTFPQTKFQSTLPLKTFGCTVYIHNKDVNLGKLDPRGTKCVFLGYSPNKKGYKCYDPKKRKYFVTCDVQFFENQSFFQPHLQGEHTQADSALGGDEKIVFDFHDQGDLFLENFSSESALQNSDFLQNLDKPENSEENHQENNSADVLNNGNLAPSSVSPIRTRNNTENRFGKVFSRREPKSSGLTNDLQHGQESTSIPSPAVPGLSPTPENFSNELDLPIALRKGTRECTRRPLYPMSHFVSYKKLSPCFRAFVTQLSHVKIPKSIRDAFQVPEWRAAVLEEMRALEKNQTWEVVNLPKEKKTVGCKWVFTVKFKSDGSLERYKARLVAKGFTQTYGIDYSETFAPVAKLNTVRVLLSIVVNLDWPLQQLDVKNAFLNGDLEEEIFMDPPPGFEDKFGSKVCKLRKSLYGLKQSPRAWFEKFTSSVKRQGYSQAQADHTLFFRRSKEGRIAILIVYVDDIILTGDDILETARLKRCLADEFEIKDLGNLKYFLGMEIARSKEGIMVSQRKYVLDLLEETGMSGCKPVDTPIDPNVKLGNSEGDSVDTTRYQKLVGRLIYLSHTRPDIAFAVSMISQFMHSPQKTHMEAAYRILRYLKGSPGKGLMFRKHDNRTIEAYTDADWAGSVIDRRSTTGYCCFVWGNLVTWRSKKQSVVARSSAEAEFRAMANGLCELIWLQRVIGDLQLTIEAPMKLFCDNKAAISIANNPVQHDRTKHVEIDRHFIKEKLESGTVCLPFLPTSQQIADILTKGLFRPGFESCISKLGLIDIYDPT